MNPFDGINPSFGPFSGLLESRLGVLLALVWACAFVYVGFRLLVSIAKLSKARSGGYGNEVDENRMEVVWAALTVVVLVAVPTLWAVLIGF